MIRPTLFTFLLLITLSSCSTQPAAINYGTTSCHACKMTIVDQQHAAQIMTKKGRTYSFDAIECMVRSLDQWQADDLHTVLVTDYAKPKELIEAQSAFFLISTSIPSPMGEHLSAFANKANRDGLASTSDDLVLNWDTLKMRLK